MSAKSGTTGTIVRKEMLGVLRDGRLLVLGLVMLAVLCAVFADSLQQYRALQQEKLAVGAAVRSQWDSQGAKNPHRGAHFGLYAFRPDSPLAAVDPGLTPHVGQALYLEPHRRNLSRFSASADDSPAARLGKIAPAFVLYALLPLLIIALCYDAVSREREQGTLRMSFSLGVAGPQLLGAKLLALLLLFAAMLLPAAAVGAWLMARSELASADMWLLAGANCVAYIVYCCLFAAAAITVSALMQHSRLALFILVGSWALSVLVMPRVGAAAAQRLLPLPDATQFWRAIEHDIKQGLPGDGDAASRAKAVDRDILQRYKVSKIEDLPVGANALRRLPRDAYSDRVHDLHFNALGARYGQQQRLVLLASLLNPVVVMRSLSMKLAGTDLGHQHHFELAAEQYRRYVNRTIDQWDADNTHGVTSFDDQYADNSVWKMIEPFSYQPPGAAVAIGSAWAEILVMLGWLGISLAAMSLAARRLQP